jgi:hypothetical protein
VSFALGLLIGFCLGVLCMAQGAGRPSARPVDTPNHEQDPSPNVLRPAEPPPRPLVRD